MIHRPRCLLLSLALVALPLTASANVGYVFYTVEDVKWGTAAHKLAIPRTFPSSAELTPSQVASEAFHKLKSYRGAAYSGASVTLDPSFASTGAASVTLGKKAAANLPITLSEVYWTLTAAGVREIRVAEVGKDAIAAHQVPFGAATIIVQLWQILPPGQPGAGQVRVADKLLPAAQVRRKLDSKDKSSVAAVMALLQSPVPYVRHRIVVALSAMNLPKTDNALIPLLKDSDAGVKKAVLKAFEGAKSKTVLSALEQVVQADPDPVMQSAAARILSAAGVSKYAVIILYDKLKDRDDGVVMDAIQKLAKDGKPEIAMAMIGVLGHKNAQVQAMAMKAIVGLKNPDALRKILEDKKIGMKYRNQAAALMAPGAGEDADRGLRHLLAHGAIDAQLASIAAVAKKRRYKLVADVIGALQNSDAKVRAAAAKALGEIKDSKALEPLSGAIAAHAAQKPVFEGAVIAIFGGLSVDEVIRFSDHKNKALRQLAIKSLSKFAAGGRPAPRILEVLKKRLKDKDVDIRRSAAFALARINDPGVVASLVSLKADPDGTIREQVATALTASKHAEADKILVAYLDDTHIGTRKAAVNGLRLRKYTGALQKLRFLMENRSPEVRRAVVRATVELAGAAGWEKWQKVWSARLYDQDAEVKVWAIRGISLQKAPQVPGLLQPLVLDKSEAVSIAALEALGKSGQKEAIEYIARALFEGSKKVKFGALDALKALNLEDCGKPIMEFVKNESDPDLKKRANEVYDGLP